MAQNILLICLSFRQDLIIVKTHCQIAPEQIIEKIDYNTVTTCLSRIYFQIGIFLFIYANDLIN